ncbi:penicillin-binding protein activator LpoB [Campylobacter canadensis]|uniref:Penicillin-binding protein activator LpoB n=1 Tax=Campylobacter canadensis TaxID=449520 RepID=A0ABS7WRB6_9BACT|nr:penicillin-binding protein activator LpoB [Campylobacter canadensis]MBZ7986916.1 penicillin-binding protein activator LpoB [Campylobacter canadensis]MBZ7994238.1 penicillin-binding protein activator LpoB [Campylobacter canadensis]MBZ7995770.1 penicillin-binding protein activator LpoB [Campylobacter canadensis]MBZ7997953.1 penicillin-binding protein activator LpoB [Campylobacter canadensis]MBZ7999570.1 penicillin-binding protein activator LpoB [Campylobacter canadensis]
MIKTKLLGLSILTALMLNSCATPSYTDGKASQVKQGDALTLGLDRQDYENAAETMINSMLSDPAFANIKAGTRKVIAIGRVVNDTPQRIDTEKLTAKITTALRKSGKFILTSAVAAGGALDSMSEDVRELRDNDEFNQKTIAKKGTLVSPDFSLAGKIRQDNVKLSNGKTQVEYFFLLRLTDLTSGLVYWEDEQTIDKTGSSKSVTW